MNGPPFPRRSLAYCGAQRSICGRIETMEATAAVFRKVQAPLTIEPVEIDRPWPREVLVRTAATGFATAISMSSTGSDGSRSTARSCT